MARLYANENFPLAVVESLRLLGHDVLTVREAGTDNQRISDEAVLAFATAQQRAAVTGLPAPVAGNAKEAFLQTMVGRSYHNHVTLGDDIFDRPGLLD